MCQLFRRQLQAASPRQHQQVLRSLLYHLIHHTARLSQPRPRQLRMSQTPSPGQSLRVSITCYGQTVSRTSEFFRVIDMSSHMVSMTPRQPGQSQFLTAARVVAVRQPDASASMLGSHLNLGPTSRERVVNIVSRRGSLRSNSASLRSHHTCRRAMPLPSLGPVAAQQLKSGHHGAHLSLTWR